MTAFEYPLWDALMAPPPGAEGRVQVAGVEQACPLDIVHVVQVVDVTNVLPPAPAFVRQLVVRLLPYPPLTAAQ